EPGRGALLRELVLLDVEYRRRRGEACLPVDYAERFPGLTLDGPDGATGEPTAPHAPGDPRPVGFVGAGHRIGDYEGVEEIARGGMGVVYRARDTALGREVAVKLIQAGSNATAEERERFRREAEATARIQHPGIVQVHEVGEHHGLPFLVMELVPGGSL